MVKTKMENEAPKPEHHLYAVISGELQYIHEQHYRDPSKVTFHGFFADRAEAVVLWKSLSMANVDNAHYRARIVKVY